ncbi:MAG: ABC transporter substrate binding protein, partial [Pseudolabrys sp.]
NDPRFRSKPCATRRQRHRFHCHGADDYRQVAGVAQGDCAAQQAIYPWRFFAEEGGLLSYGSEQRDFFRLAASYVDRIFKGEKPADLPAQAPTEYKLVINLKTANALGLVVPPALLDRADKVIE